MDISSSEDEQRGKRAELLRTFKAFVEHPDLVSVLDNDLAEGERIPSVVSKKIYKTLESEDKLSTEQLKVIEDYLTMRQDQFNVKWTRIQIMKGEIVPTKVETVDLEDTDEEEIFETIPWRMPRRLFDGARRVRVNGVIPSASHQHQQQPVIDHQAKPVQAIVVPQPALPLLLFNPTVPPPSIFRNLAPQQLKQQPAFISVPANVHAYAGHPLQHQQMLLQPPYQPMFSHHPSNTLHQPSSSSRSKSPVHRGVQMQNNRYHGSNGQAQTYLEHKQRAEGNPERSSSNSGNTLGNTYQSRGRDQPNTYKRTGGFPPYQRSSKQQKCDEPSTSRSSAITKPTTSRQSTEDTQTAQRAKEVETLGPREETAKNTKSSEKIPATKNGLLSSNVSKPGQPARDASALSASTQAVLPKPVPGPSKILPEPRSAEPSPASTQAVTPKPAPGPSTILPEPRSAEPSSASTQAVTPKPVTGPSKILPAPRSAEPLPELAQSTPEPVIENHPQESIIPLENIKQENFENLENFLEKSLNLTTTREVDLNGTAELKEKIKEEHSDAETVSNPDLTDDKSSCASNTTLKMTDFNELEGMDKDPAVLAAMALANVKEEEVDPEQEREEDMIEKKIRSIRCRDLNELILPRFMSVPPPQEQQAREEEKTPPRPRSVSPRDDDSMWIRPPDGDDEPFDDDIEETDDESCGKKPDGSDISSDDDDRIVAYMPTVSQPPPP